jgi:CO dehydrogenase maturation factor
VAGKGGAGKTTITATLARVLAGRGHRVVAVDADSNPNLGIALGLGGSATPTALPTSLISRRLGEGPGLVEPVDAVVERYALPAPGGVHLLAMGMPTHAEEGCLCSAHATVSALLGDLASQPSTITLVDLEASPEHLSRGTARHADVLVLVAEPYYRSLEAVRRLAVLATELPITEVAVVVNKVRSDEDHQAVAEFCDRHGLRWLADVPWSDEVTVADRARVPLVESAPAGAAVAAVGTLADAILHLGALVTSGGDG